MWTERRLLWLALALVLAAFLPSLHGQFVWDDVPLIEQNQALRSPTGFVELATRDLWGQATGSSTQLYHPVPMLTIWAQTQLFGVSLAPLRALNILLHLLAVGCLVQLLRRLGLPSRIVLGTGLLVAVHPSVCEPVMWVTGRHDSLALLLLLAALLLWPAPDVLRSGRAALPVLGSGLCLALAFLSKEPYIIGPGVLLLWVVVQHALASRRPGLSTCLLLALAALPLGLALLLRHSLGVHAASAQLHASPLEHAVNFATLVWHYGLQLCSFDNGLTISPFAALSGAAVSGVWLVVVVVSCALSLWALRDRARGAPALLGWLWFLLALCPHLISVPSIGLFGNRYAYCALFGLAICVASVCAAVPLPSERSLAWARGGVVIVALLCALRTGVEASAWRDNRTLYSADVARAPDNGYAYYHLGTAILRAEGCTAALPLFLRACELAPSYERPFHNAAGCLINLGRTATAQPFALRSVALSPYDARARYNLALAELALGHMPRAREQLGVALRLAPGYEPALRALAELDVRAARSP